MRHRTPPLIHFNLDFAGIAASAVKAWLDPFLRETLVQLLVWPNRIVVPLLPEQDTGPLDKLFLRHVLTEEKPWRACLLQSARDAGPVAHLAQQNRDAAAT